MEREAVTSSNVESIGYSVKTRILEVEFKGGSVYQYHGVPESVYLAVMEAPSVGRALNMRVKGVYQSERVDE